MVPDLRGSQIRLVNRPYLVLLRLRVWHLDVEHPRGRPRVRGCRPAVLVVLVLVGVLVTVLGDGGRGHGEEDE